jgi:hypothetical protein
MFNWKQNNWNLIYILLRGKATYYVQIKKMGRGGESYTVIHYSESF